MTGQQVVDCILRERHAALRCGKTPTEAILSRKQDKALARWFDGRQMLRNTGDEPTETCAGGFLFGLKIVVVKAAPLVR